MIHRPLYLERLLSLIQTDAIVVITGVRRCGKSSLLDLYAEHLKNNSVNPDQIIKINFESALNDELKTSAALHAHVKSYIESYDFDLYYLLLDEVQEVELWARTMNSLRVSFPLTICVTGSNSKLFAGEDLTYMAGRYVELQMYPLSLSEYREFRLSRYDNDAYDMIVFLDEVLFQDYLSTGAFPAVALAELPEVKHALLQGIVDSVMICDVVSRGNIDNDTMFRRVAQFIFDNIGSFSSPHNIANTLISNGRKISTNTVERYLGLLCDAFVLYKCPRYDIKGKQYLVSNPKYYVVDTGLRNTFLGERPRDLGHVLENLVYLELLRRNYEVAVGRIGKEEIDFVATHQGDHVYIQVTQTLMDSATSDREFRPLLSIKDAYPKYIMSLDDIDYSNQGIKHIKIQDFLRGASI